MGRWRRTTACERAAQWISLELDGELGELERRRARPPPRPLRALRGLAGRARRVTPLELTDRSGRSLDEPAGRRSPERGRSRARIVRRAAASLALAVAGCRRRRCSLLPRSARDRSSDALASRARAALEFAQAAHVRDRARARNDHALGAAASARPCQRVSHCTRVPVFSQRALR